MANHGLATVATLARAWTSHGKPRSGDRSYGNYATLISQARSKNFDALESVKTVKLLRSRTTLWRRSFER